MGNREGIMGQEIRLAAASSVQVTSPAPREVWHDLVALDPEVLVFQTPDWTDALCANGEYIDASRLYEFPHGRRLLLPLVRQVSLPLRLSSEASMPNSWGMGGLIAAEPPDAADIAAVFDDLRRRPVLRASIRPNPLFASAWASACPPGVTAKRMHAHVLDLQGGFNEVWSKCFTGEARTAVRKAERSGLVVECDTTGRLILVFYELFQRSVERWAGQQHEPRALAQWRARRRDPLEKFQTIARAVGNAFHLWVAWKDSQPAAAILVMQSKNASYTRGAMDKDLAGPTRANQLLHRLAIEDACKAGCRRYHMGESGNSSSLAQFKSRFGAEPVDYAEYWVEKLPITTIDRRLRGFVKKVIGFKDAE